MLLGKGWAAGSRGGARIPHRKDTAECETVTMPVPSALTLPMLQHLGAVCSPLVKAGDSVKVGQVIADSDKPLSAPIHSGVSGTVTGVMEVLLPGGQRCPAVTILADGKQEVHESAVPPRVENFDDFIRAVRASGLVGLGGAGFPAHIKLRPRDVSAVDTILVNAAECEPYITSDYRECMENSWDIVSGVQTVMEFLDAARVIIAVEKNKPAAIAELRKIARQVSVPKRKVEVRALPSRYPQGAEKVLIAACTGRRVPPGKLPSDVGCVVMNVTSAAFLARYLKTGMPLTQKRLTVAGSGVVRPQNVRAVIGTPISEVLAFCGGLREDARMLLMGGPMMGLALMDDSLPVLKQNNALLAFTEREVRRSPETACIRCGRCAGACPMNLQPFAIETAYRMRDVAEMERRQVMVCMECGCCSYVCPASRPLTQRMRLAKGEIRRAGEAARKTGGNA